MTQSLEQLFSEYRRSDAPGCVVGLASNGVVAWRAAFGMASIEHAVANSVATRMPIASVAKQFTCAAVHQLAAEGKMALDEPIGKWIPELSPSQRKPTLRQLMTHTGGLRCYLDHLAFNGFATLPAGMPARIQCRQTEVNFPPGSASSYCNGGYLLLSWAVERAADAPLEEVLSDKVFAPAGMHSTRLPRQSTSVQLGGAICYQPAEDGSGWRHSARLSEELLGAGGIVSTVDDLLRWAKYLRGSDGPISLDDLSGGGDPKTAGAVARYGHGLIAERWRGVRLVQHAGGLPGVSAQFLMAPEKGLDIVVLGNQSLPAVDLSLKVLEALLGEELDREAPPPSAAQYEPLLGHYLSAESGLMLGFMENGGALALSLFGGSGTALRSRPVYRDCLPFSADVGTGEMLFRCRPGVARTDEIEYFDGVSWHGARRITGRALSADAVVDSAAASYFSDAAQATLTFRKQSETLVIELKGEYGSGAFPAASVGPDLVRFWMPGFSDGMLARLEGEDGSVERVVVSTSRTRKTVFARQ